MLYNDSEQLMQKYLVILFMCFISEAHAGFPPFTDVESEVVYVGQEVFVGYDPLQSPCLQGLANFQGLTEYMVMDDNNFIDITIVALGTSPCLNIGVEHPPYQYYSLGTLPVGQYTVQMYWADNSTTLPVVNPAERVAIGQLLTFGVVELADVPSLHRTAIVVIMVLFLMAAIIFKHRMNDH